MGRFAGGALVFLRLRFRILLSLCCSLIEALGELFLSREIGGRGLSRFLILFLIVLNLLVGMFLFSYG
mgnify:FL=1